MGRTSSQSTIESTPVKMPHRWKSHVAAHKPCNFILSLTNFYRPAMTIAVDLGRKATKQKKSLTKFTFI